MSICALFFFQTAVSSSIIWVDYAKTMLALTGVCLAAFVLLKLLMPRLNGLRGSSSDVIQVLAKYPLETKKTLYLVRVGKAMLLLAAAGETIQFMTKLNPEDLEGEVMPAQRDAKETDDFRRIAQSLTKEGQGKFE
jgi:flagellar biogenesis protein FliO